MSLPTEHTLNVMKLRQQFTWLLVALRVEWLNLKWQWPKSWENQLVSGGSIFEINCRSCYKLFIATLGKHGILYAWFGIKTCVTIMTTFSWNSTGSLSWSHENYLENVGSLCAVKDIVIKICALLINLIPNPLIMDSYNCVGYGEVRAPKIRALNERRMIFAWLLYSMHSFTWKKCYILTTLDGNSYWIFGEVISAKLSDL